MNYVKVQQDFIKTLYKEESTGHYGGSEVGLTTEEYEDESKIKLIGIGNGYAVYMIPKNFLFIDPEKAHHSPVNITKILTFDGYHTASRPGVLKEIPGRGNKKITIEKFESESEHAWIDIKLIKYFDKDAVFHIKNRKSSVYITENNILAGVVMPVCLKEEN